ncbi:hypothetical protein [Mycoplasma sp. BRA290]
MKNKAMLIQILQVKNIFRVFNDIEYSSAQYLVEEYSENLYDTVSLPA